MATPSIIRSGRGICIFGILNPNYKITYEMPRGEPDFNFWNKYLNDPNEKEAHKEQIKFQLQLGQSVDEIIREKFNGVIDEKNYTSALKYEELVRQALKELEEEKEEMEDKKQ